MLVNSQNCSVDYAKNIDLDIITVTWQIFKCFYSSDGLMVYACGRYVHLVSTIPKLGICWYSALSRSTMHRFLQLWKLFNILGILRISNK